MKIFYMLASNNGSRFRLDCRRSIAFKFNSCTLKPISMDISSTFDPYKHKMLRTKYEL